MKDQKQQKLTLNKETISDLSKNQMGVARGGKQQPACWENLWTMYECDVIRTL